MPLDKTPRFRCKPRLSRFEKAARSGRYCKKAPQSVDLLIRENLVARLGGNPDTAAVVYPTGNSSVASNLFVVLALVSRISGELFKPKKYFDRWRSAISKLVA